MEYESEWTGVDDVLGYVFPGNMAVPLRKRTLAPKDPEVRDGWTKS